MELYIEDNLTPFLLAISQASVFLIFAVVFLRSYLRTRSPVSSAYMFATLCVCLNWSVFATRCAFFPSDADFETVRFFWYFSYVPGGIALFFFALASLLFTGTDKRRFQVLTPVLVVLLIIGIILMTLSAFEIGDISALALEETTYADVKDVDFPPLLLAFFAVYIIATLFVANGIFVNYLLKAEKGTFTYKRVTWLEAGLALLSLGYFIDGIKIDILFLIFLGRIFISTGGLLMLYGLRLAGRKPSEAS